MNRPKSGVRKMMELAWSRPDVVHLELGEPAFDTPYHVQEAASRAAAEGHTRYAPTPGLPQLRSALTEKIRTFNGIAVPGPEQVLVTNGGANALFAIFGSVLDKGDSILLPNPGWSNFPMISLAFQATPVYYSLTPESGYLPDLAELESLVDERTRALVLNSPSNPLGSVIDRDLAERLYAFCEEKDIWLIADDCYDGIDFSGRFISLGSLEQRPERVISVFSFSKVYAMTGWRVGYCAVPPELTDPMLGLLQPSVMCVNTPAQYAALAAVTGPQDYLEDWREQYRENRDLVLDKLEGSPYSALRPDGGFYIWLDVTCSGSSSEDFAVNLLDQQGVAVTPGSAFGSNGEGYVRLSLAAARADLDRGIDRLLDM